MDHLNKLPQITLGFWVMKICATTLGETAGDLFSMTMQLGYALSSLVLFGFFLVTLSTQLAARKSHPALYWTVILSTSMAGTTMSDFMDRTLALGYPAGSAILLSMLALIFLTWRLTGKSMSVTEIRSRPVEILYWTAILFSNTLGTAVGDFLSDSSGLGFIGAAALVGSLLALVAGAYYYTPISRIFLFWMAFVLTRPFGASFGDVLTKSTAKGGIGFGTMGSSAVLMTILVIGVVCSLLLPGPRSGERPGSGGAV